jgi:hypothetical protein
MAVNKPIGDNARRGAVKNRSQVQNPKTGALGKEKCRHWSIHGC